RLSAYERSGGDAVRRETCGDVDDVVTHGTGCVGRRHTIWHRSSGVTPLSCLAFFSGLFRQPFRWAFSLAFLSGLLPATVLRRAAHSGAASLPRANACAP